MPLYEYVCKNCEHKFEALVHGGKLPSCPACDGTTLEQQFSTFSVSAKASTSSAPRRAAGPCGGCGHPDGPGSCSME